MKNQHVQKRKCTSKTVETTRRYQKAFYFVDNLRENVLRNVYSLDLNYDMELKIHGRRNSFGKTEDNGANTSEVEVGRLVQNGCM